MKKIFFVIGSLALLSSAYVEEVPVYSVKVTPLQDTLLDGYDNKLQILKDGLPYKDYPFDFEINNATAKPSGIRGIWVVHPFVNDSSNYATVKVTKNDKTVLTKDLVIISVLSKEQEKRARAIEKANEKE